MSKKPTYEELERKVKSLAHMEAECNRAMAALRASEKKHRELLERLSREKSLSEEYINSLPGLFYVLDEKGMVKWNREWNIIGGYRDEELAGKYGIYFFEGEDQEGAKAFAVRVFRDGASNFEAEFVTKDGSHIPYYFTGIRKKLNGKDHLIGLGIDITERKREEKEKQRLQKELQESYNVKTIGTLAGGIAHKFNNALCEITGNIELYKIANPNSKDIDKYTDRMLASVNNMANLSNQLLAYAKGGKYRPQKLSLLDFFDSTLSIIQHKITPAIRIETDVPADTYNIMGDQTQIQMLISAIIENAVEAIEGSGCIKIILRNEEVDSGFTSNYFDIKHGRYVCLKVIDNGNGMNEETKRRIFEPFYTTHFYGRGLGMAAAYGIVKNHNGWISIDSETGKGTVVSIYLPAAEGYKRKEPARKDTISSGSGTILLIEDEEMVLEVGRAMLEKLGYYVLAAECGRDALNIASNFSGDINVALLDMGLPDISGKELFLKLMAARPKLKVIVISGYSIYGPARDVLDAGAHAFIQKPFVFAELSEKLKQMIDRRKHKRFKVTQCETVRLQSNLSQVIQITDISMGGLGFCYIKNNMTTIGLQGLDVMDVALVWDGSSLENILCTIVSDTSLSNGNSLESENLRKCGVRFDNLKPGQKEKLDYFIQNYTTSVD